MAVKGVRQGGVPADWLASWRWLTLYHHTLDLLRLLLFACLSPALTSPLYFVYAGGEAGDEGDCAFYLERDTREQKASQ